jgi:DNA polymerase-4
MALGALCRDCGATDGDAGPARRCAACGSPRLVRHAELHRLAIAHLDCDAFYAAIEKRDRPELRDRAVIVGGGRRGVVSAACYTARLYGVRSAMPMFKALQLCPDAVAIKPEMAKYAAVGRQIRALMETATPLVEPLSIDEAFLDLSGTETLHGGSPARWISGSSRGTPRTRFWRACGAGPGATGWRWRLCPCAKPRRSLPPAIPAIAPWKER